MKYRPRHSHPFLETLRYYQVGPLGGDSSSQNDPSDPGGNVGRGNGTSSGGNPVGSGSTGSFGGSRLGGDSRESDSPPNRVGGSNSPNSSPPPASGNKPSTAKPGSEESHVARARENNFSSFPRDPAGLSAPEARSFNRSDIVRLHQDLQSILARPEMSASQGMLERAFSDGLAGPSSSGLASLITQALSVLNQNPVALTQGVLQGSLKKSTAPSSAALSSLYRSLGLPMPPSQGEALISLIRAELSSPKNVFVSEGGNASRQGFLGSLQSLIPTLSLLTIPSGNGSLFRGLSQGLGLGLEQGKAFWNCFLEAQKYSAFTKGIPLPLLENPGVFRNFIQGLGFLSETFGFRWLQPFLSPFFRAFVGAMLMNGEGKLNPLRSTLLDEMGALMARKMRRFKRKERKGIRRSDRVAAKDQSLPVDTHSQKGEESLIETEGETEAEESDEMMGLLWFST